MLSEIAGDMMIEAAANKKRQATRKLSKGLELTLYDRDEYFYLRLYRAELKLPSQTEITVCKNAFFGKDVKVTQEGCHPDSRGGTAYWIKVLK